MTREDVAEIAQQSNGEALLADGFEAAFIGMIRRCGQPALAAYSTRKAVRVLMDRDGMSHEEAVEFFEFNVVGAWCGPHTPAWLDDLDEEADVDGDDS